MDVRFFAVDDETHETLLAKAEDLDEHGFHESAALLRCVAAGPGAPASATVATLVGKIRAAPLVPAGLGYDVEQLITLATQRFQDTPANPVVKLVTAVQRGYRPTREEGAMLHRLAVEAGAAEVEEAYPQVVHKAEGPLAGQPPIVDHHRGRLRPVDPINKPGHYAAGKGAFVQDHCDAFELRCTTAKDRNLPVSTERFLGAMEHNATKYIWRAGEKPQPGKTGPEAALRDWRAAAWYVARGVEHLEALVAGQQQQAPAPAGGVTKEDE